jgi:hypothetical protein
MKINKGARPRVAGLPARDLQVAAVPAHGEGLLMARQSPWPQMSRQARACTRFHEIHDACRPGAVHAARLGKARALPQPFGLDAPLVHRSGEDQSLPGSSLATGHLRSHRSASSPLPPARWRDSGGGRCLYLDLHGRGMGAWW